MKYKFFITIAGASILLSFLSIISKGIGFIREIIYAHNFGLSPDYDLFLSSTALITVFQIVFIFFIQHYFIPAYNRIKINSEERANEFFNYIFWWSIIIGILLVLLLFLFSKPIMYSYLSGVNNSRINRGLVFYWIFLLTIPFNNGISVVSAFLQSKFSFIYPAVCQILINVIVIIIVFFLSSSMSIIMLPISFAVAYFIGFIIILKPVYRLITLNRKVIFRYELDFIVKGNLIYLFIIEFLSLSYVLVDRYFINKIPPGSLSAINYATVLFALPVSVITIPLATTIFAKFSREHTENSGSLHESFFTSMKINYFIIMLMTFIMFNWGDVFLRLFYQRGAFNAQSTLFTNNILKYYLFGLLFYTGNLIQIKFLYSINKYSIVMWLSLFAFTIKIFLNIILLNIFQQNGLALSTSIVYMFLFLGAYLVLNKVYFKENKSKLLIMILFYLINAIVSILLTRLVLGLMFNKTTLLISFLELFLFTALYFLNNQLLKGDELQKVIIPFSGWLKNKSFSKKILNYD